MDAFKTAKQMLKDYDLPYTRLEKNTFENIQKIIQNGARLSLSEWQDMVKQHNLAVYCALLIYEITPEKIKLEAIAKAKSDTHAEKQLFLPMIFSKDIEVLAYMTREVSEELVGTVDINNVIRKANLQLTLHPEERYLPFSGSHVEELLIKKVLDGSDLDSIRKTSHETYRMIEMCCDVKMLNELIGDYESQNEYVLTAMMNNIFFSTSTRERICNIGADFTQITAQQSSNVIKNLYYASIDGLKKDAIEDYGAQQSLECMKHLINYDLLFESCSMDFFHRYMTGELNEKKAGDLIVKVVKQTHSPTIIEEAMWAKAKIASAAIRNPDAPPQLKLEKLEAILDQQRKSVFPSVMSTGKKEMTLAIVETTTLKPEQYSAIIASFGDEKNIAKEAIVLSPHTPKDVLLKMADDINMKPWLRACALILSEKEHGLSEYDAKKMADTLKMISIKKTKEPAGFFVLPQFQFMPDKGTTQYNELQNILNSFINRKVFDTNTKVAKEVAKEYNKAIERKSAYMLAKQSIGILDVSKMSKEDLALEKEVILDETFGRMETLMISVDEKGIDKKDFTNPTNYYEVYTIVEKMVQYAERYQKVIDKLEQLEKEEGNRNFMKIFNPEETR